MLIQVYWCCKTTRSMVRCIVWILGFSAYLEMRKEWLVHSGSCAVPNSDSARSLYSRGFGPAITTHSQRLSIISYLCSCYFKICRNIRVRNIGQVGDAITEAQAHSLRTPKPKRRCPKVLLDLRAELFLPQVCCWQYISTPRFSSPLPVGGRCTDQTHEQLACLGR